MSGVGRLTSSRDSVDIINDKSCFTLQWRAS